MYICVCIYIIDIHTQTHTDTRILFLFVFKSEVYILGPINLYLENVLGLEKEKNVCVYVCVFTRTQNREAP